MIELTWEKSPIFWCPRVTCSFHGATRRPTVIPTHTQPWGLIRLLIQLHVKDLRLWQEAGLGTKHARSTQKAHAIKSRLNSTLRKWASVSLIRSGCLLVSVSRGQMKQLSRRKKQTGIIPALERRRAISFQTWVMRDAIKTISLQRGRGREEETQAET